MSHSLSVRFRWILHASFCKKSSRKEECLQLLFKRSNLSPFLLTPALLLSSDVTHHPVTGLLCKSRFHFKINDFLVDCIFKKAINNCRRKLIGLTGTVSRGIFKEYFLLPRIICMFPRWYHLHEIPEYYPLPSKTLHTVQTNFPSTTRSITRCEEEDIHDLLKLGIKERIFARRPKTIVVVISASGNPQISKKYFKCVIDAVSATSDLMAKFSVICLTKFIDRLPLKSPDRIDNIFHIDFCPFSPLLKYLKAHEYNCHKPRDDWRFTSNARTWHTTNLVPISFDQPDNARRLEALRVALTCPIYQFSKKRCLRMLENIEKNIDELLKSCEACRHDLFERDPAGSGLAEAADIILETLTGKTGWQHEMDLVKKRDFSF